MVRMKILCATLFAVSALAMAFAVTSALALELPDEHVLSGDTYPATSVGEVKGTEVAALETELGEKLTASSIKVQEELTELTSLGPSTFTLTGVGEPKSKTSCNTAGDAAGTVKFSGEHHITIVDVNGPLVTLTLFKELVVECNSGKLKIKVRSPVLAKMEKITAGTDVEQYGEVAKCSGKGKQEQKQYLNDEGKATKAVLTANFGLGFETACENVSSELVMKSSKMVDFLF